MRQLENGLKIGQNKSPAGSCLHPALEEGTLLTQ
jgi:hypothetical protein